MERRELAILSGILALTCVSSVAARGGGRSLAAGATAGRVARGEYLVRFGSCHDCHTPHKLGPNGPEPDMTRALSGHPADLAVPLPPSAAGPWIWSGIGTMTAFAGPWGVSFTANLTPDKETGLGNWTEEMFLMALRTGRHEGKGRPILPPMPYRYVGSLSDEDLKAVFAYLQSLPPVRNRVPAPIDPPEEPSIPERLSQTGLYLPGAHAVDPRNRPFVPQYPLWTDGARKSRWVHLPPGTRIDARNVDQWVFPVGTRLWKEFAFEGRKVETRMLWRTSADAWSYAAYVWNEAQTDATLAPPEGVRGAAEVAPGKRHTIPSREDCRTCHENGATPVLGFTALQLSTDRDPLAPNAEALLPRMVTLRTLVEEERFDPPHPEFTERPPRIPGDARTRAALGYLTANCGHCHNERSAVATVRFPLSMPPYASAGQVDEVIHSLLARRTKWDLPHAPPGTTSLVTAGAPDRSALFVRMRSRRPSSQMPPLGTVVPDRQAMELVSAWIDDLSRR